MKRERVVGVYLLAGLIFFGVHRAPAALSYPFLSPVRSEVISEMASLTDTNLHPVLSGTELAQLRALPADELAS